MLTRFIKLPAGPAPLLYPLPVPSLNTGYPVSVSSTFPAHWKTPIPRPPSPLWRKTFLRRRSWLNLPTWQTRKALALQSRKWGTSLGPWISLSALPESWAALMRRIFLPSNGGGFWMLIPRGRGWLLRQLGSTDFSLFLSRQWGFHI